MTRQGFIKISNKKEISHTKDNLPGRRGPTFSWKPGWLFKHNLNERSS
jgi:hypothetical protein